MNAAATLPPAEPSRHGQLRRRSIDVLKLAIPLAYGGVLWMQLLHEAVGASERHEPPFVLHWLRDATLALPVVFVAVWAALAYLRRLGDRSGAFLATAAVATFVTVALAMGTPVHARLFEVDEGGHAGDPSLVLHVVRDAALGFPIMLLLAAGIGALLRGGLGRRFAAHAAEAPAPADPVGELAFTRSEVVKICAVGSATLFLPFKTVSAAWAHDLPASPPVRNPFTQELPIPPPLTGTDLDIRVFAQDAQIYPPADGGLTEIWGYEGITPGPTILAESGVAVQVTFHNDLFGEESLEGEEVRLTTHLHGGHQSARDDGYPTDITEIPDATFGPGDERSYEYPNMERVFVAPEPEHGAPLWYHDHLMDETGLNVWMGLAAAYLIHDPREDSLNLPGTFGADKKPLNGYGTVDIPLFIQDRRFRRDFSLLYPHEEDGALGDRFLVNGAIQPFFEVDRRKYRFRIYNGSNARWYKLALDSGQEFIQVGTEGGLLPEPVRRKSIPISPAERADVIIDFRNSPGIVHLVTLPIDVPDVGLEQRVPLLRFVVGAPVADTSTVPSALRTFAALPPPVRNRSFKFDRSGGEWTINNERFDPNRPLVRPSLDTVEHWTLENSSGGWVHPIHTHLARARVLLRNGKPPPPWERGEKDTLALGKGETVKVAYHFTDFPGPFVFHCHNIEHEDMRMMARFDVVPPPP